MVYEPLPYTMIYKNGEHKRDFLGLFVFTESSFLYFGGIFNKTILFHLRLLDMRWL